MQIEAKALKSLLKHLSHVKSEQIVFDTASGRLSAKDAEMELVLDTPLLRAVEAFEQHVFAVSQRRLSAVLAKLSGAVSLEPGERLLGVKAGRAKLTLEVFKAKSPAPLALENAAALPLASVLPVLRFAALAAEPNRAAPTGGVVELKTASGEYQAAATDTQRLHIAAAPAEYDCGLIHLPLPVLNVLTSLPTDKVELAQTPSALLVRAHLDNLTLTIAAGKLAKTFPDYRRAIPKTFAFTATLDPVAFKAALDTVAPMVGEDASGRQDGGAVLLTFSGNELSVRSYGLQNQAEDTLAYESTSPVPSEDDDPFGDLAARKFSLKIQSLLDFVGAAKEPITFSGNDVASPVLLRSGAHTLLLSATVFQQGA